MSKGTVNKVYLIGRVGGDPTLRYTPGGTAVANFSLATTETWKDKEGNTQDKTTWHKITAWGKLAEIVGEYVVKGSHIYVEGRLDLQIWTDRDDVKRYTTKVIANQMQILNRVERPDEPQGKWEKPTHYRVDKKEDDDSEVPF